MCCVAVAQLATTSDHLLAWATAVGAAASLGLFLTAIWAAVFGVKAQIDLQRVIERRRRVFDHQGFLNSREFAEMSAEVYPLNRLFETDPVAAAARWEGSSDAVKLRVIAVFNFYELVATEYNSEFLDRTTADKNLAYAVVFMWNVVHGFLDYLGEDDEAIYEQWRLLVKDHGEAIERASRSAGEEPELPPTSLKTNWIVMIAAVALVAVLAASLIALIDHAHHNSLTIVSIALFGVAVLLAAVALALYPLSERLEDSGRVPADIGRKLLLAATLTFALSAGFTLSLELDGPRGATGLAGPRGATGPAGPQRTVRELLASHPHPRMPQRSHVLPR